MPVAKTTSGHPDFGARACAGYETTVSSVRVGAPGYEPFGGVGRVPSTTVRVTRVTPSAPPTAVGALPAGTACAVASQPHETVASTTVATIPLIQARTACPH